MGQNIEKQTADKAGEEGAYSNHGLCYPALRQFVSITMMQNLERHLNIAKQIGDKAGESSAYDKLGDYYCLLEQYEKAVQNHEMRLNIAKQIGDKAGERDAYVNLGVCFYYLEQYDKARQHHEMHLNIAKQIGDKAGEGMAYDNLGVCYRLLGQYEKAIQHHEMHLKVAKQIGNKAGERDACVNLGFCYRLLQQYQNAIQHYEMYLDIAKQIGDKAGEIEAYVNLGVCYSLLRQYEKAIRHNEMGLNIAQQIGDKVEEGMAELGSGSYFHHLGQYEKAIQHYEMALNIAQQIGDKPREAVANNNLGVSYFLLGQCQKAIQHQETHLNIAKQIGDKAKEGRAYNHLGVCYAHLGQYERAIENHEMHLNIVKQIGEKLGEGMAYGNLGVCYGYLGLYEKAKQHIEMLLNITKQIGDKAKEAEGVAYGNLGVCYCHLGNCKKAIQHYEMHLNIADKIRDKLGEGAAYGELGTCYRHLEQYEKAIQHHKMHLNIAQQIGHKSGEGMAHGNLGSCYHLLGQYEKAIQHHEMHLKIAEQIGDKAEQGRACNRLGVCFISLSQYDSAELNLIQSLSHHEELVKNTPKKDEYLISIREQFAQANKCLIKTLIHQGKTNQALVIAERGRSRALAEIMLTSYSINCGEITGSNMFDFSEIRKLVTGLGSTVLYLLLDKEAIFIWVIHPNGDVTFRKHNHGITMPDLKYLISKARMAQRDPCVIKCEDRSLAFLYSKEFVEPTQNKLETVLPDISAFEKESNSMTESTSSPNKAKQRNIFEQEEEEEQRNIEEQQEGGGPGKSMLVAPLNQLYKIIMGPVRELIEGSQVVVVPDRELYLVPFAALKDDKGKYVAESLQVRLVTSLSTAKMMSDYPQKPESGARPLIVGDPDAGPVSRLPFASEEASVIGRLLNVQPLTGKDATKENVLRQLENANLIHIAAHGDRERGEIVLALNRGVDGRYTEQKKEDYMLMMSDLDNKCLRAKLVVLSCCHSARGEIKSEGVIGMARAFLGAGARSVVVALWAIDDEATMYFMKSFYKHLKCGKTISESHNKAMKAMREMTQFREPVYWAPFVLIGDDATIF